MEACFKIAPRRPPVKPDLSLSKGPSVPSPCNRSQPASNSGAFRSYRAFSAHKIGAALPVCHPLGLAIVANQFPIRGPYLSFLSHSATFFCAARLLTIPSVLPQNLFRLVRFLRTFLQAPLEASGASDDNSGRRQLRTDGAKSTRPPPIHERRDDGRSRKQAWFGVLPIQTTVAKR
jgi:hypothetical protein